MEDAWLPTEQEKVAFFDLLGIDRQRIPHRIYQGAVGNQTRYFALKLPIAANAKTATFAYVDPGKYTDTELRSWGNSHEWLWRALRLKGIEVRAVAIGADHKATIRAEAALETWSQRAGEQSSQRADGPSRNDPAVKEKIHSIEEAVLSLDTDIIAKYGGLQGVSERLSYLKNLPKASGSVGATIDGFETWVSSRVKVVETVMNRSNGTPVDVSEIDCFLGLPCTVAVPIFFATYIRGGLGQESAFFCGSTHFFHFFASLVFARHYPAIPRQKERGGERRERPPLFWGSLSSDLSLREGSEQGPASWR